MPVSPSAPDSSWTTPARPGTMPVSPTLATHETAETPDPVVSPGLSSQHPQADDVSASVAGSVLAAQARYHAHESDAAPQGSQIGTTVDLPEVPTAHSKHVGGDGAGYPSG